jgi:hypothetical protein
MKKAIEDLALEILGQDPALVVRYRLLRDVLKVNPGDSELQHARRAVENSRSIQGLAAEQWEDGSWGAFHSRDSRRRQKIITTEVGVERGLNLGLDTSHPVLINASEYVRNVMLGKIIFPDRHEKNDRWSTGLRLFLASTLSLIHPRDPLLDADRVLWSEIADRTFQSGEYNAENEIQAHAELTGATVEGSYLVISGKYQLNILGSTPGTLPQYLELVLLQWLWGKQDSIGYLGIPLGNLPPNQKPGPFDRWLVSLELLARLFPAWVNFAQNPIEWIWEQRNTQGFWDFGPRPASMTYLPLSDNWRRRKDRQFDWTTRILILLRRYLDTMF